MVGGGVMMGARSHVLGPTQKDILELIREFTEKGLTINEILKINKERDLRLPRTKSQFHRSLKVLEEKNFIFRTTESDNKTLRYFPVDQRKGELLDRTFGGTKGGVPG
jgi:Fe2+ or Zn2+ uptake regulation protein